jgi:hypothetical protein
MFLRRGLDRANQLELVQEIKLFAQALWSYFRHYERKRSNPSTAQSKEWIASSLRSSQ